MHIFFGKYIIITYTIPIIYIPSCRIILFIEISTGVYFPVRTVHSEKNILSVPTGISEDKTVSLRFLYDTNVSLKNNIDNGIPHVEHSRHNIHVYIYAFTRTQCNCSLASLAISVSEIYIYIFRL